MADEIPGQNVIRVTKDGDAWSALIGPDPQLGLAGFGSTPLDAVHALLLKMARGGWIFDETWQERRKG